MLNVVRTLTTVTAYLIALCVVDVSSHLIDIFSLPVPRTVFGFTWSIGLCLAVIFLILPEMKRRNIQFIGIGGGGLLVVIMILSLMEAAQSWFDRVSSFELIAPCLSVVLVSQLLRIHKDIFFRMDVLVNAFVRTAVIVSSVHLIILIPTLSGISVPLVNAQEVYERNSLSLLLVAAVWVVGSSDDYKNNNYMTRLILLSAFTMIHILFNDARAAAVLLILCLSMLALRIKSSWSGKVWPSYILATLFIMIVVSFSYPILNLTSVAEWLGQGDDILSSEFRSHSNWMLWRVFMDNPLFGIGWAGVVDVRSGGYISHTLYLMLLSAYGITGFALLLLWLGVWIYSLPLVNRQRFSEAVLLIVAAASFSNDILIWYGMIFSLVGLTALSSRNRALAL